jgi:hypothetical protein
MCRPAAELREAHRSRSAGIAVAFYWFAIEYSAMFVGFSWRLKKHAELKI